MRASQVLILIPARFASARFPGKPLEIIEGKSLIERVYTGCLQKSAISSVIFDVAVVTDDERIEKEVLRFGGKVCRIDEEVETGSERIALAFSKYYQNKSYDLVINVQGDEPLIQFDDLLKIVTIHLRTSFDIFTLVKKQKENLADFSDANKVKVALSHFVDGHARAVYFSRASVPCSRDNLEGRPSVWYSHIGIYSYRPTSLEKFIKLPVGALESIEKLEQLRALENGLTIGVVETQNTYIGVDLPSDIAKVKGVLNAK